MEIPEKHLETLISLGLTNCQSKVYFAAVQNKITTAKKISEATKIARPYVYAVITELEKLGLIEKTIGKHSKIKAIPLQTGISFLVHRKMQETQQLAERAQKIFHDFDELENETSVHDYTSQFIWLSEREPYIRKRREEIENAQKTINFVTNWKRFPLTAFTFGEVAEKALKRKVKVRAVMQKPPQELALPKIIDKFKKYPNYHLRFTPNPPSAILAIFDGKRIIVDVSSSAGLAECPALWSNNRSLLSMMKDYYEILWTTAIE